MMHDVPDPLSNLPLPSRRKYEMLQRQVTDAVALTKAAQSQIDVIEHALRMLINQRDSDPPRADEYQRQIDEHTESYDTAHALVAKRRAHAAGCSQVVAQVNEGLRLLPRNGRFKAVFFQPELRDGESVPNAVRRVRGEIDIKCAELNRTHYAPIARDELEDQVKRIVAGLASQAEPSITFIGNKVQVNFGEGHSSSNQAAARMQAFVNPESMTAALLRKVEGSNSLRPGEPISDADRVKREEALKSDILKLERVEESLLELASESGLDLPRREDASLFAILGIASAEAPQALAA